MIYFGIYLLIGCIIGILYLTSCDNVRGEDVLIAGSICIFGPALLPVVALFAAIGGIFEIWDRWSK